MITLICCVVTLISALISSWTHDLRRGILALWVCGLGMGGVALDLGAEFLAVTVWIISTVSTIGFVFYSVMFGEFRSESNDEDRKMNPKKIFGLLTGIIVGFFIFSGLDTAIEYRKALKKNEVGPPTPALVQGTTPEEPIAVNDQLGEEMVGSHFLTLELLGFTLFLILVASGVIARPKRKEGPTS